MFIFNYIYYFITLKLKFKVAPYSSLKSGKHMFHTQNLVSEKREYPFYIVMLYIIRYPDIPLLYKYESSKQ